MAGAGRQKRKSKDPEVQEPSEESGPARPADTGSSSSSAPSKNHSVQEEEPSEVYAAQKVSGADSHQRAPLYNSCDKNLSPDEENKIFEECLKEIRGRLTPQTLGNWLYVLGNSLRGAVADNFKNIAQLNTFVLQTLEKICNSEAFALFCEGPARLERYPLGGLVQWIQRQATGGSPDIDAAIAQYRASICKIAKDKDPTPLYKTWLDQTSMQLVGENCDRPEREAARIMAHSASYMRNRLRVPARVQKRFQEGHVTGKVPVPESVNKSPPSAKAILRDLEKWRKTGPGSELAYADLGGSGPSKKKRPGADAIEERPKMRGFKNPESPTDSEALQHAWESTEYMEGAEKDEPREKTRTRGGRKPRGSKEASEVGTEEEGEEEEEEKAVVKREKERSAKVLQDRSEAPGSLSPRGKSGKKSGGKAEETSYATAVKGKKKGEETDPPESHFEESYESDQYLLMPRTKNEWAKVAIWQQWLAKVTEKEDKSEYEVRAQQVVNEGLDLLIEEVSYDSQTHECIGASFSAPDYDLKLEGFARWFPFGAPRYRAMKLYVNKAFVRQYIADRVAMSLAVNDLASFCFGEDIRPGSAAYNRGNLYDAGLLPKDQEKELRYLSFYQLGLSSDNKRVDKILRDNDLTVPGDLCELFMHSEDYKDPKAVLEHIMQNATGWKGLTQRMKDLNDDAKDECKKLLKEANIQHIVRSATTERIKPEPHAKLARRSDPEAADKCLRDIRTEEDLAELSEEDPPLKVNRKAKKPASGDAKGKADPSDDPGSPPFPPPEEQKKVEKKKVKKEKQTPKREDRPILPPASPKKLDKKPPAPELPAKETEEPKGKGGDDMETDAGAGTGGETQESPPTPGDEGKGASERLETPKPAEKAPELQEQKPPLSTPPVGTPEENLKTEIAILARRAKKEYNRGDQLSSDLTLREIQIKQKELKAFRDQRERILFEASEAKIKQSARSETARQKAIDAEIANQIQENSRNTPVFDATLPPITLQEAQALIAGGVEGDLEKERQLVRRSPSPPKKRKTPDGEETGDADAQVRDDSGAKVKVPKKPSCHLCNRTEQHNYKLCDKSPLALPTLRTPSRSEPRSPLRSPVKGAPFKAPNASSAKKSDLKQIKILQRTLNASNEGHVPSELEKALRSQLMKRKNDRKENVEPLSENGITSPDPPFQDDSTASPETKELTKLIPDLSLHPQEAKVPRLDVEDRADSGLRTPNTLPTPGGQLVTRPEVSQSLHSGGTVGTAGAAFALATLRSPSSSTPYPRASTLAAANQTRQVRTFRIDAERGTISCLSVENEFGPPQVITRSLAGYLSGEFPTFRPGNGDTVLFVGEAPYQLMSPWLLRDARPRPDSDWTLE